MLFSKRYALAGCAILLIGAACLFLRPAHTQAQSGERRVQEFIFENVVSAANEFYYDLGVLSDGDTLYVYLETTHELQAELLLWEGNEGEPASQGMIAEAGSPITLTYEVPRAQLYAVELAPLFGHAYGDYRLLIGINAPEVLTGQAEPTAEQIIPTPLPLFGEVRVGLFLLQISDVNQQAEGFTIEAVLNAEWQADCPGCLERNEYQFADDGIVAILEQAGMIWPEFTLANQRGQREFENRALIWNPSTGVFWYEERFKAEIQIPHFDFTQFPFDRQIFPIWVESFGYREQDLHFSIWQEKTGIGSALGEEEWIIHDLKTSIGEGQDNRAGFSRFAFELATGRHITYYLYRIFVPILLILTLSWVTFFIHDDDLRISTASGTLLAFIAFNFTIGDDLPRIAYLTFLDTVLIICFAVSAVTVVITIMMKFYEETHPALVKKLERLLVWAYPIVYVVSFGIVVISFFCID